MKHIEPQFARQSDDVKALFTLRNSEVSVEGEEVKGLNFGKNTLDPESVVLEKRQMLYKAFDIDPEWVAIANQVHSSRVRFVTSGGTYEGTDGLVTTVPGLTLGIQVADCAAVLLADPKRRVIAAVHAGWRGAVADIIPETLKIMKARGAEPLEVSAFISPCITQTHFEVGEEVADLFPDSYVDRTSYTKPHVDLKGFVMHQLKAEGVASEHIECDEGCTYGDAERHYSYRREGDQAGRMVAMIQLKPFA